MMRPDRKASLFVALSFIASLGCGLGQPRVYVLTSTMVGLEAKPPMSDGQPNPAVTFGYKRQEIALIPVCPVGRYDPKRLEPNATMESRRLKCTTESQADAENKQRNQQDAESKLTRSHENHNPSAGGKHGVAARGDMGDNAGIDEQKILVPAGSAIKDEQQHQQLRRQDSYSTLGLFRMGLSWFGPAKIEQFVATGQAAVAIQGQKKEEEQDKPPPKPSQTNKDEQRNGSEHTTQSPTAENTTSSSSSVDGEKKKSSEPKPGAAVEKIPVPPPSPSGP